MINDNDPSPNVTRRCVPARALAAIGMPEVFNPIASPIWNPNFKPKIHSKVVVTRSPPTLAELSPAQFVRLTHAIDRDNLYQRPSIDRLLKALPSEEFGAVMCLLARGAFTMIEQHSANVPIADLIERLAGEITPVTIAFLADSSPDLLAVGRANMAGELATGLRILTCWISTQSPACDLTVPETVAIYGGPDAMRHYIAAGGNFGEDPAGGFTLAHHAAQACYEFHDALATFITLGGAFNDQRNSLGRTPTHELVLNASSPHAITAFALAGGRFNPASVHAQDRFHHSPITTAYERGPDFEAAFYEVLALSEGAL